MLRICSQSVWSDVLPVFTGRVKPDVLVQFVLRSIVVISAAPLSSPDRMPSGGPVHAAVEPGLFDKGFDETEITVILMLPVLGQALSQQGEEMGAKIGNTGLGQDQEPAVVAHPGQVFLALFSTPSDEVIPGGELPGGGTEAEQGQGNKAAAVQGWMVRNQPRNQAISRWVKSHPDSGTPRPPRSRSAYRSWGLQRGRVEC